VGLEEMVVEDMFICRNKGLWTFHLTSHQSKQWWRDGSGDKVLMDEIKFIGTVVNKKTRKYYEITEDGEKNLSRGGKVV
jgi:hypothetical protein